MWCPRCVFLSGPARDVRFDGSPPNHLGAGAVSLVPLDDLARDLTDPPARARPRVVKVVSDYAKDRRLCYTLALGVTGLAAYTAYQTSQPDIAVQFREVDEERRAKAKRKQREAEAAKAAAVESATSASTPASSRTAVTIASSPSTDVKPSRAVSAPRIPRRISRQRVHHLVSQRTVHEIGSLRDVKHAESIGGIGGDVRSIHRPRRGFPQPRENAKERRLPGAVGARDEEILPRIEREIHLLHQ